MITAFVLMKAEVGHVPDIASRLSEMKEVVETYSVTGEWDIVSIVKVPEFDDLAGLVTEKISQLAGVARTHTIVALRFFPRSVIERTWSIGMENPK